MQEIMEKTELLTALCILRLPNELMDKNLLKNHFSQFGSVRQVILSTKNNSCVIHFTSHESAKNAYENGKIFEGKKLHVFWSHVKSRSTAVGTGSPEERIKERKKSRLPTKLSSNRGTKTSELGGAEGSSEIRRKSLKPKPKKKMSPEVEAELLAMSGIDEMRPIQRPSRTLKALPPVPVFKETPQKPVEVPESGIGSLNKIEDLYSFLRKPAVTSEERYNVLEARDKLMRTKNVKAASLAFAEKNVGTCPDMCPEKERYHREAKHQVFCYEMDSKSSKQTAVMDAYLAVKQYSRSSADQDMPLPHDLRPAPVLRMTMEYMLSQIVNRVEDPNENLRDWYFFLWDRTRSIRKDITQQELCDTDTVTLLEQCARFHIFCSEYMVDAESSVFDPKINTENLTKCLQTLKYMYGDMSLKGEECPNKPEFQAYILLLNLNDTGRMIEELKLNLDIQAADPIKYALSIYGALSTNNYVKFFKLVKETTYLNACILHRYFTQVRVQALFTICQSYSFGSTKAQFSVSALTKILAFDDDEETVDFCGSYGLKVEGQDIILTGKNSINRTQPPPQLRRSVSLVATKKDCSVAEVICGGPAPSNDYYKSHTPHNSFDSNGILMQDAYDATDQALHLREDILKEISRQGDTESETDEIVPEVPIQSAEKHEIAYHQKTELFKKVLDKPIIRTQVAVPVHDEKTGVTEPLRSEPDGGSLESKKISGGTQVSAGYIQQLFNNIINECVGEMIRECCIVVVEEEHVKAVERNRNEMLLQKRQRLVEEAAESFLDELIYEVGTELIRDIVYTLAKEIIYEEIFYSILDDELELLVETTMDNARKQRLQEISHNIANRKLLYYLNKWRSRAHKMSKRRMFLRSFSFQPSNLNLKEQADLLEVHGISKEYDLQSQRLFSQQASVFKPFLQIPPLPNIGVLEVDKIVEEDLTKRLREIEQDFSDVFWKMMVSIPDTEESPHYSDLLVNWTDQLFHKNLLSDDDVHLLESDVLMKTEARTALHTVLGICVQRITGVAPTQGSVPNEANYGGTNGILFILSNIVEGTDKSCRRLIKLLRALSPQPHVPVAIIDLQQFDSMKSCLNEKWLHDIKNGQVLADFSIFQGNIRSKNSIKETMVSALKWLASKRPRTLPVYICYLPQLWETCFTEKFWSKIEWSLADNSVFVMQQNPKTFIHLYNAAIDRLLFACLDEDLLEYSFGPPEFEDHLDDPSRHTSGFQVCPKYWGSPHYCKFLFDLMHSLQLSEDISWPPVNYVDLLKSLEQYCTENQLQYAVWDINRLFEHYLRDIIKEGHEDLDFKQFLADFPWIRMVEILAEHKLRSIDYTDPFVKGYSKRPIVVIVRKSFLEVFLTTPWWLSEAESLQSGQLVPNEPEIMNTTPQEEAEILPECLETEVDEPVQMAARSCLDKQGSPAIHGSMRLRNVLREVSLLENKVDHLEKQQNSILAKLEKELISGAVDFPHHSVFWKSDAERITPSFKSEDRLKMCRNSVDAAALLDSEMKALSSRQEKVLEDLARSIHEGSIDILCHTVSPKSDCEGITSSPRSFQSQRKLKRSRNAVDAAALLASELKILSSRQEKILEDLERSIEEENFILEHQGRKKLKIDEL
ncbi:germinal-center associated nuclear protein [Schistocerca gregaria]|uniref:germinal-center associated nuclear protein n=1 Tax=Schistocerca gregaria TaxID=7010 RepID=UPI00211ED27F|nr:germinal-center associated nuclear protein [Schistocerca gregaria]